MTDDAAFEATWREAFTPDFHEQMPVRSSLVELDQKLEGAHGFLNTLDKDVEHERRRGLWVAKLAINYANGMVDHFGLMDGFSPFDPTSLKESVKSGSGPSIVRCQGVGRGL